jgi:hypothetical protein
VGVSWIHLAQDSDWCWTLVDTGFKDMRIFFDRFSVYHIVEEVLHSYSIIVRMSKHVRREGV